MGFRPTFWPTLFTVPALIVLIGFGTWQVERLHWKEGLIAARTSAAAAAPADLPATIEAARPLDFHRVRATGEFLHDKELFIGATAENGATGVHVVTPLRLADGRILLVNRGFVPSVRRDPKARAEGQVTGPQSIVGIVRVPVEGKPSWFSPDNRPDLNYWFYIDLPAMIRASGLPDVLPYTIDADATPVPGGWPRGGTTRLQLPNNHLQYAITWYSFAVSLAVIYFLYHRRRKPNDTSAIPT